MLPAKATLQRIASHTHARNITISIWAMSTDATKYYSLVYMFVCVGGALCTLLCHTPDKHFFFRKITSKKVEEKKKNQKQ